MKFLASSLVIALFSSPVLADKNKLNFARKAKHNMKANDKVGRKLINKARKLENNQDYDNTFIAKYSIKFQGCHHVPQWNDEANDEEDVRVLTKRLVRFRLCPTDTCTSDSWDGCSSDYGDYVVDLETFTTAYWESMLENQEMQCEAAREICGDSNYCLAQNGMQECIENENQGDDDVAKAMEEFDPIEFMECREYNFENGNQQYDEYGEEVKFYIGPFCADQGGSINLALFTDESCTAFYSDGDTYFKNNAGFDLPFSEDSMIPTDCLQCKEYEDEDQNNGQDNNDNDDVNQVCEEVYDMSGKCETNMQSATYPNEGACNYISGIRIVKQNGSIATYSVEASSAASICIGIFTTSAVLLAAYVYYLKTKIGRAKITLLE